MNVPLLDLKAQYNTIKSEIDAAVSEVIESQYFIMGPNVHSFEQKVADYCNTKHALGCASGSDALLLALMALEIGPGDYVITTPFTFFATAGAISRVGAIPVFADIDPITFNIDPIEIEAILLRRHKTVRRLGLEVEKIKAIIPVHLYGQMANMQDIMKVAKEFNLAVIEDAAQSIGASLHGVKAGNYGDFGCFSFFPSKNLGAYGDAGLITVKDSELAEKIDILRLHGARPKYHNKYVGMNSRLDAIQAAVLEVKLKYLDEWSDARREKALIYDQLFNDAGIVSDLPNCSNNCNELGMENCGLPGSSIVLPTEVEGRPENGGKHIYHQYTIRVQNRNSVMEALKKTGIGSAVYYPVPMHVQECYSDLGYSDYDFPHAVCAANQALSLPIYPEITFDQQKYVVEQLTDIIHGST